MTHIRRDLADILGERRFTWAPHLPPEWYGDALCAEVDPAIFFPEKGDGISAAKKICAACRVREQCLDYAIENRETQGMWGGLTPSARRKIARQRRAA